MINYQEKFNKVKKETLYEYLSEENKLFFEEKVFSYRMTFQESKKLIDIAIDFQMWDLGSLKINWPRISLKNKVQEKKAILKNLEANWTNLKNTKSDYSECFSSIKRKHKMETLNITPSDKLEGDTILGKCPVASTKTLCCNLQTLDAINNCSFDCSYCSIQSFFPERKIYYEENLIQKLNQIKFDPTKKYHIGTGQSSDSLLLGNRGDILKNLMEFARLNPNIIIELKTKSKNINYLLQTDIPKNVICTWSLNPKIIIDAEEHGTATLEERLNAALSIANKGNLVGFHFHPMIYYNDHKEDYALIAKEIQTRFNPNNIAMISIGTLTFTKPVIKELRKKGKLSKVLQIPLTQTAGKFSYPLRVKYELFENLFNNFKSWHKKVFFYFCMEDRECWKQIFGYEYKTNEDFEKSMVDNYFDKINLIKS